MRLGLSLAALLLCAGSAAAQETSLVFRIDDASATIVERRLVLSAHGAVRTGGWTHPRLKLKQVYAPEATTLDVQFVADPPSPKQAVIQALLPVTATLNATLPRYGAKMVRFVAETNSITVPITR